MLFWGASVGTELTLPFWSPMALVRACPLLLACRKSGNRSPSPSTTHGKEFGWRFHVLIHQGDSGQGKGAYARQGWHVAHNLTARIPALLLITMHNVCGLTDNLSKE